MPATWICPTGQMGLYSDEDNWDTHAVPGPNDDVSVPASTGAMNVDVEAQVKSFSTAFGAASGLVQLNANLKINNGGTIQAVTFNKVAGSFMLLGGTLTVNGGSWTGGGDKVIDANAVEIINGSIRALRGRV